MRSALEWSLATLQGMRYIKKGEHLLQILWGGNDWRRLLFLKVFKELADGPVVRTQEMQVPFLLQTSCVGSEKSCWFLRSPVGAGQTWHSGHWGGQCQRSYQNQWEVSIPVWEFLHASSCIKPSKMGKNICFCFHTKSWRWRRYAHLGGEHIPQWSSL